MNIRQPPPYHLRINKAVDRHLLIETLSILERRLHEGFMADSLYCGFGGPYMEDIRLLHERFHDTELISVESIPQVVRRQKFHLPCSKVKIFDESFGLCLDRIIAAAENKNLIFWLDYTNFTAEVIADLTQTIGKVDTDCVIKITVVADRRNYHRDNDGKMNFKKLRENFGEYVAEQDLEKDYRKNEDFICLVKSIFLTATQKTFPKESRRTFCPVSSAYYNDGTTMFSLTGFVCTPSTSYTSDSIRELFGNWEHANEVRNEPSVEISLPFLTSKERLLLQSCLPCSEENPGEILFARLGHCICEGDDEDSKRLLNNYAKFYRYYPYFIRGYP